ncbi:MAG: TonB-dependent receptor, partial [Sphingomonadaceae bacterium]|nr:TonB-dependent receptor [Sphingomonadaceae bacterium]
MKLAASLFATVAALSIVQGAQAGNRNAIDVKAGRLGDAVVQLGQQSGSSIGISDQSLTRLVVRGVRGRMSVDEAIRRLVKGQAVRVLRINERSWRIVAAPPPVRVARRVEAKRVMTASPPRQTVQGEPPVEIIVTASKRETPLSLLPATVSVIQGSSFTAGLDAGNTAAILEKLPSVSSTHAGAGRNKLFIRGIADSGFTGPTQATVGQYFGEMRVNYNAPDPDLRLYDIGSVEVLEGPQGTLYGAGSLGGIIRANPNLPRLSQTEAYTAYSIAATAHGEPSADGHAVANIPVVPDRVAVRMLAYGAREGGYIDDSGRGRGDVNSTDIIGGRVMLSVAPNDDWRVDFSGVGQSIRGDDAQYAQRGFPVRTRRSPLAQPFMSDYWLANMQVNGSIGDFRLISSAGFVEHDLIENYDATPLLSTPTLFRQQNRIALFSTEHRLTYDAEDGGGWLIGASHIRSNSRLNRALSPASMPVPTPGVENRLSEWALFGEATIALFQDVTMTVGGRISSAKLSGTALEVPPLFDLASLRMQARRSETSFLPSFAVAATPLANLTAFLRFQQGFRPGGLAVDGPTIRHFRNDRTSTIESGFRFGDLGTNRFTAMGTVAYTDWKDIQADLTDGQGFPTTANIGDGHIVSVQGQLSVRPTGALTFDGAFIFSHSRLDSPSPAARSFLTLSAQKSPSLLLTVPNVANFSGRAGLSYRHSFADNSDLVLAASARYVGKSRLGIGPVLGTQQGGYFISSVGLKWERAQGDVFLNVSNLFDATGNRYALGSPFALPDGDDYTPLRPRPIMVGFNFGLESGCSVSF